MFKLLCSVLKPTAQLKFSKIFHTYCFHHPDRFATSTKPIGMFEAVILCEIIRKNAKVISQWVFTCLKPTKETQEQGVKYIQS